MIKPKHIPDEVVEAAAMQLPGMAGHQRYARAAIAAAINAWPEMECRPTFTPSRIILPLTQENNND